MDSFRGSAALLLFVGLALGLFAPTGCKPPEMALPEGPEAPEAPSEANDYLPKGGNCCIRNGPLLESKCGGQPCCAEKMEEDKCQKAKGYWFFTPQGCAGAC